MSVQYAGGGAWCVTQGGMTVRLEDERSARSVDEMIERLRSEVDECRRYSVLPALRVRRYANDSA